MSNPRQSVGFPEVAIIHKGSPKQKVVKGDKTIEIQGKDLNNLFRMNEHYRYLAMIALKDAIPWLKQVDHSNKSVKQLLEELGYKDV